MKESDKRRKRMVFYASEHIISEWKQEADQADMPHSEWCRLQVEAGRKQIAALDPSKTANSSDENGLRTDVLEAIPEDGAATPKEVVQTVVEPIESRVKGHLKELDNEGVITYDPDVEGYVRK